MDILQRTEQFLTEIGIHPNLTDIKKVSRDFSEQMTLGLRGEDSSLAMLPCHIPLRPPPKDGSVIALDAGGTNFRRALVEFSDGRPILSHTSKMPMPGTSCEISFLEFLDFVCDNIEPLLEKSLRIGFCFSYAFEPTPALDARITALSKEVKISGINGVLLGSALFSRFSERGGENDLRVSVINDAAACLLGGAAQHGFNGFGAGLIIGTGCNISYLERGCEIIKLPKAFDMIINTEAGNFDRLPFGKPDRLLDSKTTNPGEHLFEKMVSGAYIGPLVLEALRLAVYRNLFSDSAADQILSLEYLETSDADSFSYREMPFLCENSDDALTLKAIVDAVFERAARLVCAAIDAVQNRGGSRLYLTVDGSVFYKSRTFRTKLLRLSEKFTPNVQFQRAENGNLIGAALAALSK